MLSGMTYMSNRLMMAQTREGYDISRGKRIAKENKYNLNNWITYLLMDISLQRGIRERCNE